MHTRRPAVPVWLSRRGCPFVAEDSSPALRLGAASLRSPAWCLPHAPLLTLSSFTQKPCPLKDYVSKGNIVFAWCSDPSGLYLWGLWCNHWGICVGIGPLTISGGEPSGVLIRASYTQLRKEARASSSGCSPTACVLSGATLALLPSLVPVVPHAGARSPFPG